MGIVVKGGYTSDQDTHLTIKKGSVAFSDGSSAYRLRRGPRELVIMDAYDNSLLTLRPKRPSLHRRWEGYGGDRSNRIFSVARSSVIGRSGFTAKVYGNLLAGKFEIEGSFEKRRFTVYDAGRSRSVVVEVEVGGDDVFSLCVKAGFDSAFSVALVAVLYEIAGDAVDGGA